jgi:hypothetical protein
MAADDITHYADYELLCELGQHPYSWAVTRGMLSADEAGMLNPFEYVTSEDLAQALTAYARAMDDPRDIWVLNPVPTRTPLYAHRLADRVTSWENATVVFLTNYNGGAANVARTLVNRLPASVNYIWVSNMTVISGQTVNVSNPPFSTPNWSSMAYANYLTAVNNGSLRPTAVISATGF